jgi:hypothetical protein
MAFLKARPESRSEKRKARGRLRPGLAELRVRDLNKLLQHRHGYRLPDTEPGRVFAIVMVQHLARLQGFDVFQRIPSWCELYAPFFDLGEVSALLNEAVNAPKYWKAAALGWHLRVSTFERQLCRITTIQAFDRDIIEEGREKKTRRTAAQIKRRREKGIKTREEYLANAKNPKPWVLLGVSRATYFRRKGKA